MQKTTSGKKAFRRLVELNIIGNDCGSCRAFHDFIIEGYDGDRTLESCGKIPQNVYLYEEDDYINHDDMLHIMSMKEVSVSLVWYYKKNKPDYVTVCTPKVSNSNQTNLI